MESDEEPLNEDVNSPSDKSSQWAALNNSEERGTNVPESQMVHTAISEGYSKSINSLPKSDISN